MKSYNPSDIEAKWQKVWEETGIYRAHDEDKRPKSYFLVEFPYPSGDGLHVGHARSYTALDIMTRHKRMQGFNVLYPMGFDEFGLPTENYAIKHKIAPQVATAKNVTNFTRQMKSLGLSFDWDRQVHTSDPQYYKWTQWIFLKMLEAGLAYQAEIAINWCPFEKTGLANEEVVDGKHERCGTVVEKKLLKQWMLRITAYADRLIEDLATVDYSDRISAQQINWVGRSHGAEISWKLRGVREQADDEIALTVYTTRPDTIYGATFLVASPEVAKTWLAAGWKADKKVAGYIDNALRESELSRQEDKVKTGVDSGIKAVHPLSGQEVPVWVADYVLGGYGTGAIMAVPAHDERDHEFAMAFDLPITTVIEPVTGTPQDNPEFRRSIVAIVRNHAGQVLSINWGPKLGGNLFVGGGVDDGEDLIDCAKREIAEETGFTDLKFVAQTENIHHSYYAASKKQPREILATGLLFDLASDKQVETKLEADEHGRFSVEWLDAAKAASVVEDPLHAYVFSKLALGKVYTGYGPLTNSGKYDGLVGTEAKQAIVKDLSKAGSGKEATKYKLRDWIFSRQHYWGEPIPVVHCPKDGVVAVPADQLPVTLPEVEHYEPTETGESPLAAIADWVNTVCPKCGGPAKRETDTMPNWAGSSWYWLRYADPNNDQEFASKESLGYWTPVDLYNGGMEHTTLHLLYSRFWHKFLFDQGLVPTSEPYARRRSHGMILAADNHKMSKSRGNVINPDDVVKHYGADALRLYEMFMGPFEDATSWSDERLGGISRFLVRAWKLAHQLMAVQTLDPNGTIATEVDRATHKTIKKVGEDIEGMRFNTAVSALMEYVNLLNATTITDRELARRTARALVLLLAPFAPHVGEELWRELGEEKSVHVAAWPQYDPELIKDDLVELAVQVNGKLRGTITVPVDIAEDEIKQLAAKQESVAKYLDGATIVKTIVVPRRIVNFVVK